MFEHGFPEDWSMLKRLIWLKASGTGGGGSAVLKTVSGTILQITDALARTAYQLKINITPKQAPGTPSTQNILPISGWTECTIIDVGSNSRQKTLTVNWQSEAGTVYGGTLTINEDGSADLVSRCKRVSMNGTSTGRKVTSKGSSDTVNSFYFTADDGYQYSTPSTWVLEQSMYPYKDLFKCSHAPTQTWGPNPLSYCAYCSSSKTLQPRLHFSLDSGINSSEKCNNWLKAQADNGTPVYITYPLKTATTNHLTVEQFALFFGENTIWCGDVNADTINLADIGRADYMALQS